MVGSLHSPAHDEGTQADVKSMLWPRLTDYIPIWPTPKQAAFLLVAQLEALYGGAAGGGKSVGLLAAALQFVDVPGYSRWCVSGARTRQEPWPVSWNSLARKTCPFRHSRACDR